MQYIMFSCGRPKKWKMGCSLGIDEGMRWEEGYATVGEKRVSCFNYRIVLDVTRSHWFLKLIGYKNRIKSEFRF